jgi:hypothetical protein
LYKHKCKKSCGICRFLYKRKCKKSCGLKRVESQIFILLLNPRSRLLTDNKSCAMFWT